MRKNADQNNSEYGQLSEKKKFPCGYPIFHKITIGFSFIKMKEKRRESGFWNIAVSEDFQTHTYGK